MTARFVSGLPEFRRASEKKAVATIGTFDGIHRGHQAIFARVREVAAVQGQQAVLITFDPHPRMVVTPDAAPRILTTLDEKKRFVPRYFDGTVLVLPFDQAMMNLSAEAFVSQVLVDTVGAGTVIVGYDHHFGKGRSGTISRLREFGAQLGFEVEVVEPVVVDGSPVSSSRIRTAFQSGQYAEAVRLLGHDYAIYGTVERGIGLGRRIGYPTANVKYHPAKLLPPEGVYACWVAVGTEEFLGMMFIGRNHFNPSGRVTVEANLFDFDRDIYDQPIVVCPTRFLRESRTYDRLDDLVRQLALDKEHVLHREH